VNQLTENLATVLHVQMEAARALTVSQSEIVELREQIAKKRGIFW
jgi:predicted house-cleaning noncanonical NTP pyrophosphatase (MazG superfamily)